MVTVVCTRWLDAFPASYVRLLRNAIKRNLKREHRFICVTDNPQGLDADIESRLIPDMNLPMQYKKHGCWPKLSIFAPGVLPPDEPTLYLDLDLLIMGDIDPFFDRIEKNRGFHALREWNPSIWNMVPVGLRPDRGVQGSILGFYPAENHHIYETFMSNQQEIVTRLELDQDYFTEIITEKHYWPFRWTVSFKKHCVPHYPLNKFIHSIPEPQNAKIVVFHGTPRPIDLVPLGNERWGTKNRYGYGPVSWVRNYWLANDDSWRDESHIATAERT